MYRCVNPAVAFAAAALSLTLCVSVSAQNHRPFPANALRGELVVVQAPDVRINGQAARLAPGARIRGDNNLMLLSASLTGQRLLVHYTIDSYGLLKDLWVLNATELTNSPWPQNPEQAAAWEFDSGAQTWKKR